jgi:hypothetical protein
VSGIPVIGEKPKIPVPVCPHCGKDCTKLSWLDWELPPRSGDWYRAFYCGQPDCRKVLSIVVKPAPAVQIAY